MLEQVLYHSGKFLYYLENMKRSLGVVCPAGLERVWKLQLL